MTADDPPDAPDVSNVDGDTARDSDLAAVRELVANNPGSTADELAALVEEDDGDGNEDGGAETNTDRPALNPDTAPALLAEADARDLVIEADSKYWVMRTGAYSPEHRDYDVDSRNS